MMSCGLANKIVEVRNKGIVHSQYRSMQRVAMIEEILEGT